MPAISRPLLIALILAVVAAVAFYATQGGRESTDVAAPVVPPREPAPEMSPPPPSPPTQERTVGPRADATGTRAKPSAEGRAGRAGAKAGVPPAMARALEQRKLVVLLLYRPGSADDRATSRSVAALRGRGGAVVFTDPIGRIGRYRGLVEDLGISQAPAVVIVGRDGAARVVEGYVDRATLAQDVADAR